MAIGRIGGYRPLFGKGEAAAPPPPLNPPLHTPPHLVRIATVGLKKPPRSTQQRQGRNRANKANDYSVDHPPISPPIVRQSVI